MDSGLKIKSLGGQTCAQIELPNFLFRFQHGATTPDGTVAVTFAPQVLTVYVPSQKIWYFKLDRGSLQAILEGDWQKMQISYSGQEGFQPLGAEVRSVPGTEDFSLLLRDPGGQTAWLRGRARSDPK